MSQQQFNAKTDPQPERELHQFKVRERAEDKMNQTAHLAPLSGLARAPVAREKYRHTAFNHENEL